MFSVKMTVPAGATNNVTDSNNNYLYNDAHDCFVVSTYNEKIRLFLIADNIWVVGNQTSDSVDVELMVVKKNKNLRVHNLEVLNPGDVLSLPFLVNEWYCFSLEPNQMYLEKENNYWCVKFVGHRPVYNNKVIAFSSM